MVMLAWRACRYIPQRWTLYVFTAPAIIFILSQISDYPPRMRLWVISLNVFMLAAGGLGTIPWMTWPHKGGGTLMWRRKVGGGKGKAIPVTWHLVATNE